MIRVLIVLFVIAVRAAEVVLAVLDGVSIVVESGRLIIIVLTQRKFRPTSEPISFAR